jgi:hypothetical protein
MNNEVPYSNREIDEHFKALRETLIFHNTSQMSILTRIETQTTKTNGRVSRLEAWRSYIAGSIAVVSFLVIPLVGWIFLDKVNELGEEMESHIINLQK